VEGIVERKDNWNKRNAKRYESEAVSMEEKHKMRERDKVTTKKKVHPIALICKENLILMALANRDLKVYGLKLNGPSLEIKESYSARQDYLILAMDVSRHKISNDLLFFLGQRSKNHPLLCFRWKCNN